MNLAEPPIGHDRLRIRVRGAVQGVGFRPFVHGLAARYGLSGFVRNDQDGVLAEVEGAPLDAFLAAGNCVRLVTTRVPSLTDDAIKVRVGPSLRVQTPAIRVQSGAVRDHQASGFLLESPCRSYRLSS